MDSPSLELTNALKDRMPKKAELVNTLMDIIPIGKEAIYRRLRGDIPFTLQETVLICQKMKISLDVLMKIEYEDNYTFHMMDIFKDNKMDEFYKMLVQVTNSIEGLITDPNAISYRVYHVFPQDFSFKYETLSKLYLYIILYQMYPNPMIRNFEAVSFSEKVIDVMKTSSETIGKINSVIIFDDYCFQMFIDSINYYKSLNLISHDTISTIKQEYLSMMNDIEQAAVSGLSPYGKKTDIYLSHIYLDASYSYIKGYDFMASSIQIYEVGYLTCENKKMNKRHKEWIESLLRFSTLISVSGEKQRNIYLNKQRQLIDSL